MGCLTAKIERSGGINATMSNERDIVADAKREGGMSAKLTRKETIKVKNEKLNKILVQFGLICSVNYAKQLKVSKDCLWLLPENMFQDSFAIITEVEWHIV